MAAVPCVVYPPFIPRSRTPRVNTREVKATTMSKWVVVLDMGIRILPRRAMLRFISIDGLVLGRRAIVFRSRRFRWGVVPRFRQVQFVYSLVQGVRRAPPATLVSSGPWWNETPSVLAPGQDTARSVGRSRVALG